MSAKNVLIGLVTGMATGAVLGVLFAPEKGSKTRKKISSKAQHGVEDVKDKFTSVMDSISDKFQEEKKELAAVYAKVKHRVEEFSKDGHKA